MSELWVPDKYRGELVKQDTRPFFEAPQGGMVNAAVAQARVDAARQGVSFNDPFAPGVPVQPFEGVDGMPRLWNFPTGYNIKARTDRDGRASFETLKKLTDEYEVARLCINHRIDDVRSLDWTVVPEAGTDRNMGDVIALAKRYLRKPDGRTHFRAWLAKYLEDVLRYDAGVLAKRKNRAGRTIGLEVVQGSTIAPVVDYWGRPPTGDAPAFVQFVNGLPWKWFTSDALIYAPFRPQSDSMYGLAPIEGAWMSAATHMRFQHHWLEWFTQGTVPDGFGILPENVGTTPDDRERWQTAWDKLYAGDTAIKSQIKWMPFGTSFEWPKDHTFDETFPTFLMKIVCAVYAVTPADIGFTDDVNRATGETQVDVQFRVGTRPLLKHIEDILTSYLQDDMGLPVVFKFDEGRESEDRESTAKVWEIGIKYAAVSPDEMREEVFGLEADTERPVPRAFVQNMNVVPVRSLEAVAGPIDPDTAAPDESEPLGTEPFKGVSGVLPEKPRGEPQITRAPINPDDPSHPEHEGEVPGSGIVNPAAPAALAQPAAAVQPKPVAKSEDGAITVAGLAVVAEDTGRVLMIQRAITDGDPAAGRWEFPGGHLEDGEGPLVAAAREWAEETGMVLPGTVKAVDSWDNGIYRLHVATIPREDDLNLNPDDPAVVNPDDPDGDITETVAWWEPRDLPDMPALRDEARDTPWAMIENATPGTLDGVRETLTKWRRNSIKTVKSGHLPRKFQDSRLPASVEARVWKRLRGARDTATVDAAFAAAIVKAADADPKGGWRADPPNPEPQHSLDLRLTDFYQPEVQQALDGLWTDAQVERFTGTVAGSGSREQTIIRALVDMSFGAALSDDDLHDALMSLWRDAYQSGALAASKQLGIATEAEWAAWKPGLDASQVTNDGGWAQAIQDAGVTLKGITGESLNLVARAIEQGIIAGHDVDTIARQIRGAVGSPARAELISHTETARMLTRSSMQQYAAFGVQQWDLVVSAGACPTCLAVAAANPHPLGDTNAPPIHPRCRCAASPHTDH